ncbi:MAG: hypothetical protein M5U19_23255 [Microthrixaceae bacterium]|nr:hypothetical protein [Microthrixaceae bacterium]
MTLRPNTTRLSSLLVAATLGVALLITACGEHAVVSTDRSTTRPRSAGPVEAADAARNDASASAGTITVRIEETDGYFIEGFEVGLRFEAADGSVIASTLWSDFVNSLYPADDADLDAHYNSVLTQPAPPGRVRVSAAANVGQASGPEIPDPDGDLPCTMEFDVATGKTVALEVRFGSTDPTGCLALVDDAAPTTTTAPAPPTTAVEDGMALPVGSTHYVDVDLQCRAFDLGGVWRYVEGNIETWQDPGERHEGGALTIMAPGVGNFSGNLAGTKTATFLLVRDGASTCQPQPRSPAGG